MFYKQEFGIDLGTDTIKIYDKKEDSVISEKNMVVVKDETDILAVGDEAYDMYNRVAADTKVITPVKGGRILDILYAEAIIHSLLFQQKHYVGHNTSIYFAVPSDMTEIEKRAYASIAKRGKLRNCFIYLVEKPIADALALGIPISKSRGSVMINVGAFGTDLSVIAGGHVVLNSHVPIGGDYINESISSAVRTKNHLNISVKKAEKLKRIFCSETENKGISLYGTDTQNGLPRNGFITAHTVKKEIEESIDMIGDGLLKFLERIPPQIKETASREGIMLIGGSSRIKGIEKRLSEKLNYPIHLSSLYENSTVNGLKEVISYSGANKLAYAPMQKKIAF